LTAINSPLAGIASEKKLGLDLGVLRPSKVGAALALAMGFFAYLPYPAIPAGNNTAIQAGNLLTLLMVLPVISLPWSRKPFMLYPVLVIPLLISAMKVSISEGNPLIGFKLASLWIFSMLTLVAGQLYAPRYPIHMMVGIAICSLLHCAVGAWQMYGFHAGYLPLAFLYVNPSFASVQLAMKSIIMYVQRPFGLFPEPSAMSSSLGPWILFWFALALDVVKLRTPVSKWLKVLFSTAAVCSLALTLASRSGHIVFILAGLGVIFSVWMTRRHSAVTMYAILVVVVGVIIPLLLWFTTQSLQSRMQAARNETDSWEDRSSSLEVGFRLAFMSDGPTLIFGMGVGQSNIALWDNARLEAVWSVLLTYIYEQGIIGLIAVIWVGVQLVEVWRRTRFKSVYAALTFVWAIGITLTTSYQQLLPTWIFLAWLTVWRDICDDGFVEFSSSGMFRKLKPGKVSEFAESLRQPGPSRVRGGHAK
jgi:hypothetical protein